MVIAAKNLTKIFGRKRVVDDVSVRFQSGMVSAVVGTGGSGKTTLMRLLAGELKPDSGKVAVKKSALKAVSPENSDFFTGLKIADHCTIWTLLYPGFDTKLFRSLVAEAGIAEGSRLPNLSESMKKWLGISFVIASNADIMIFDEPLQNLEPELRAFLISTLGMVAQKGRTVIVSMQEIGEFEKSVSFVAALNNGSLVLSGETQKLLASHRLLPGASTISPDYKVIGPVFDERLAETTDEIGRIATLKEIILGYINGSSS